LQFNNTPAWHFAFSDKVIVVRVRTADKDEPKTVVKLYTTTSPELTVIGISPPIINSKLEQKHENAALHADVPDKSLPLFLIDFCISAIEFGFMLYM
jgi:hypothetical protein